MEGQEFVETIKEAVESEPLKGLNLKLVGIGCEKIVFETPGSQRKVIKVNIDEVLSRIALKLGLTTEEQSGNGQLKDLIAEHKVIEADLIDIFGGEHVLKNGVFRGKIPLSRDILLKLTDGIPVFQKRIFAFPAGTIFEIEALVETQIMANELKDQEKFKTRNLCIDLVTHDSFCGTKDVTSGMSLIREFVDSGFLTDFEENSIDLEYVETIREILVKIIQFSKRTGLMMDIFGPNNLTVFTNEKGRLDYHLLDVILPGPRNLWEKNIKDDKNFDLLRHYYQFYYAVKSLGDRLGIVENLEAEDLVYFKNHGIPTQGKFPER